MFSYYIELANKPKYMLSYAENMYIELFPYLVLAMILVGVVIIAAIVECIKDKKK